MLRQPKSNDLDPSHPLWKKAVRVRDVKSIGMTLYRVHPGVTVNDRGFLDSTSWVLVDLDRIDGKRVTKVYRARWPGRLWGPTLLKRSETQRENFVASSPGWDHEKALLRLDFSYTITNPRYVIVVSWQTEDAGCFWSGSDWRGAFFAKRFTHKKRAENALVTMTLTDPKLIGQLRITTV